MSRFSKAVFKVADTLESFVFAVFMVLICFMFFFRTVQVKGQSMENTLYDGDRLVISHFWDSPNRGDIVVANSDILGETIIKRVIATENQTVVIDQKNSVVKVDGEKISEDYLKESDFWNKTKFSDTFYNKTDQVYEYMVPNGYVFLMGDNRNGSTDGRLIGFVSKDEIVGKAVFRYHSSNADLGRVK